MGKLRVLARRSALCLCVTIAFAGAACTAIYRDHGYAPSDRDLGRVEVGATRDAVDQAIGYPGITGVLTDSAWYYVGSRWRHYGASAPEPVSREVLAISFTPQGRVANIERFGLEDGRVVALSRRVTDTGITSVSFISQLLRSVGNIQADQFLRPDQ